MKRVLLYSGGMDSWLIDKLWKPDIKLYVNFHTKASFQEMSRLPKDVIKLDFDLSEFERKNFFLPYRNLLLITIAANYGDVICLGSVASDVHLDNSDEFIFKINELINFLSSEEEGNNKKIISLYSHFTKEELLYNYVLEGGDIDLAERECFSCYKPENDNHCHKCKSCNQKFEAFKTVREWIKNGGIK